MVCRGDPWIIWKANSFLYKLHLLHHVCATCQSPATSVPVVTQVFVASHCIVISLFDMTYSDMFCQHEAIAQPVDGEDINANVVV